MPSCCAARTDLISTAAPSMKIFPESGACTPARIFISVLLPAPFPPTTARTSPRASVRETFSSASTPGKRFATECTSNNLPHSDIPLLTETREQLRWAAFLHVFLEITQFQINSHDDEVRRSGNTGSPIHPGQLDGGFIHQFAGRLVIHTRIKDVIKPLTFLLVFLVVIQFQMRLQEMRKLR